MVGLSVVLEAQKGASSAGFSKKNPQVINKATMMMMTNTNKPSPPPSPSTANSSSSSSFCRRNNNSQYPSSSFPAPSFLEKCFLCGQKLLPGKDIYMYKGDRAFCSVECRCRQIFMDEEETPRKENCSLAAITKPTSAASSTTTASSSSSVSSSASRQRKTSTRNRAGGFAY